MYIDVNKNLFKVKSPDLWGEDGNMSSSPSWSEERAQLTRRLFEVMSSLCGKSVFNFLNSAKKGLAYKKTI